MFFYYFLKYKNISIIILMGTHINDVYYCNLKKIPTINERIFSRNKADIDLEKLISCRPVITRRVDMPMIDCRKPTSEKILKTLKYDPQLVFNPSHKGALSGFNVDVETQLFNQNRALQRCAQSRYIPGTNSELYNESNMGTYPSNMIIERKENFSAFNPNKCRLGNELFYNDTRQQTKNVKLQ